MENEKIESYEVLMHDMSFECICDFFTQAGEVNQADEFGEYPLTAACKTLQIDVVEYLLKAGASVHIRNSIRDTPLLCAIDHCHHHEDTALAIVKTLIAHGAELEERGYMDKTPFLKACTRACPSIIRELAGAGCDIHAVVRDIDGVLTGWDFANIHETSVETRACLRQIYGW